MNLVWFGSVLVLLVIIYTQRLNGEFITLQSGGVWASPTAYSFGRLQIDFLAYAQDGSQVYLCLEDESDYEQVFTRQFCRSILSAGQNYSSIYYSIQSTRNYIFVVNRESTNVTFDISIGKVENQPSSTELAVIPPDNIEQFTFELSSTESIKLDSYSNTTIKIILMSSIDNKEWHSETLEIEPQTPIILTNIPRVGPVYFGIQCKHKEYCLVTYSVVINKYDATWAIPVGIVLGLGVTIISIVTLSGIGCIVWKRSKVIKILPLPIHQHELGQINNIDEN